MLRSAKAVLSAFPLLHYRPRPMVPTHVSGSAFSDSRRPPNTITGLKRWSVAQKDIPPIQQIKAIHVYDFDNTLFSSPLPNPQVWNGQTIGYLQTYEGFLNGGWWHDPNLLSATGEGADIEETRAWKGWWNEYIVQLVELSMQQRDALTVLLTGRGEAKFTDIIKRIVASRNLAFDLICLKPEVGPNNEIFSSTMIFKRKFLEDLVLTYKMADEIRVYEDRVRHVKGFRDYFEQLNQTYLSGPNPSNRRPILAEVIHVAEGTKYLPPVTEVAEVQNMINSHNSQLNLTKSLVGRLQIKRTIFYTGYLISNADSSRLISQLLLPLLPPGLADSSEMKYMANSVLITPRPAPKSILDKVGGMGKKLSWRITGIAAFENKLWAARVKPVPENERYYTENPTPIIVLALRKGARPIDAGKIQNWQPVPADKAFVLETVVGEKVVLRVEEISNEGEWESQFIHKGNKRRHQPEARDEDIVHPPGAGRDHRNGFENPSQGRPYTRGGGNRPYHDDARRRGSSGYRGRGRGSARGRGGNASRGGGRGRSRGGGGGPPSYRSLDDHTGLDGSYEDRSGTGVDAPYMNY